MGRHSAQDDDEDAATELAATGSVLVAETPRPGRHAAPELEADVDDGVEADVDEIEGDVLAEDVLAESPDRPAASATAATSELPDASATTEELPSEASLPGKTRRATNADLRMLRENPTLRARCAAALVVPFMLYTVVLLVIGRANIYLFWLWIPTVTAGVVAGMFMDRAAHAAAKKASTTSE